MCLFSNLHFTFNKMKPTLSAFKTISTRSTILRSLYVLKANTADQWDNYYKVPADAVLLDLEDAVLQQDKAMMRTKFADIIPKIPPHANPWLRINSLSEGTLGLMDIEATLNPNIVGYLLSKILHENEILEIKAFLDVLEKRRNCQPGVTKLMPVIESPECSGRLIEIVSASSRISHIVMGSYDLQAEMFTGNAYCQTNQLVAHQALIAAKSLGIGILQSPLVDLDSHSLLEVSSLQAYEQGFSGRICLTPAQVITVNNCFQPSHRDYTDADVILANKQKGIGIMKRSEQESRLMIGPPMVTWATKVQNLKNAVQERESVIMNLAEEKLGWISPKFITAASISQAKEDPSIENTIREFNVDESFRAVWNASVVTPSRMYSSATFWKNVMPDTSIRDLQVPYFMLLFLTTLVDSTTFEIKNTKWIKIKNADQIKPAFYGDRLYATSETIKRNAKYTGDKIIACRKLYRRISQSEAELLIKMNFEVGSDEFEVGDPKEISQLEVNQQHEKHSECDANDNVRTDILRNFRLHNYLAYSENIYKKIAKCETYVHQSVCALNSFDFEPVRNFFNIPSSANYVGTNLKSKDDGLVAGLLLAKSISNVMLDFGDILWSKIDVSLILSNISEGSLLASVSYIKNIQICSENPDLEEVELVTLGLRDLEPNFLMMLSIPIELLQGTNEPRRYNKVTETHCRALFQKISTATEWRFLRPAEKRN